MYVKWNCFIWWITKEYIIIDFYTYDCYNEVVFLLQALVHGPPQSMPISPWFWMLSLQVGHALHGPPQSIPASCWFWIPSLQVGHALHGPPQSILSSSWLWIPSLQLAHGLQGPPQSMPDSPWFWIPSMQLGTIEKCKIAHWKRNHYDLKC